MKLAVVIVDMQGHYVSQLDPSEADRIIPRQLEVIDWCRKNKVPIFVLTNYRRGPLIPIIGRALRYVQRYDFTKSSNLGIYRGNQFALCYQRLCLTHLFFMGINGNVCLRINVANARFHFKGNVMTSPDVLADKPGHDDPLPYYRETCDPYFESAQAFMEWAEDRTRALL